MISRAWAFQRSFFRKFWNKQVHEWFRDIDPAQAPSNASGRQAARAAVLIGAQDDKVTVSLKIEMFREYRKSIEDTLLIAGIPYEDIDREIRYHPKVTMFFRQDMSAVPDLEDPETGVVSFRLMDKDPEKITAAEVKAVARKVKTEFALNGGYIWKKGKNMVSTRNQKVGLPQKVLCLNEPEGMEMYRATARVLGIDLDEDLLKYIEPKRKAVTNPTGSVRRLGRRVKKKKWRPIVNVRFQAAEIKIHGLVTPIALVDRGRYYRQAIEKI